jgi:hypothetical protein
LTKTASSNARTGKKALADEKSFSAFLIFFLTGRFGPLVLRRKWRSLNVTNATKLAATLAGESGTVNRERQYEECF